MRTKAFFVQLHNYINILISIENVHILFIIDVKVMCNLLFYFCFFTFLKKNSGEQPKFLLIFRFISAAVVQQPIFKKLKLIQFKCILTYKLAYKQYNSSTQKTRAKLLTVVTIQSIDRPSEMFWLITVAVIRTLWFSPFRVGCHLYLFIIKENNFKKTTDKKLEQLDKIEQKVYDILNCSTKCINNCSNTKSFKKYQSCIISVWIQRWLRTYRT